MMATAISIHALREEGDNGTFARMCETMQFQSTPSARRATVHLEPQESPLLDFNPRPPRGGRLAVAGPARYNAKFQSTPSARRATESAVQEFIIGKISIHALREEGDSFSLRSATNRSEFQSTPSARRATVKSGYDLKVIEISIHALREEGDFMRYRPEKGRGDFNPRPPRGGRPLRYERRRAGHQISIHALREEGDSLSFASSNVSFDFNPRPPRGGRLRLVLFWLTDGEFQSTPSARRATIGLFINTGFIAISIHALRVEGDGNRRRFALHRCYFNPRPPRGGRQQKRRKNPPRLFHYTHLCTI